MNYQIPNQKYLLKVKSPNFFREIVSAKDHNVLEYQLCHSQDHKPDYQSAAHGPKPQPGKPIFTDRAIRFHVDDVR